MSDSDERRGARLPMVLAWVGVGLAPIAVLVILVGSTNGSLRFAVLLLAVAVVFIGASVIIRNDPVLLRLDVEDLIGQETDALHDRVREDITVAVRAVHKAFGEKLQVLHEQMQLGA